MSDSLEILNPPSQSVQFNNQEITITPVRMGKLAAFTAAVRPIANDVMMAIGGTGDLLTTIELHGDRMVDAVSIATGIDVNTLGECLPDEFIRLTRAVIEVNADFFIQRLAPELKAAFEGMKQKVETGQTQFKA